MSTPDSACWSGLNARRGVLQPSDISTSTRPSSRSSGKSSHDAESLLLLPDELDLIDALEDEQQQTFSPVGTSAGARPLYLIQTPRGAGAAPPTVIWATSESRSELAWGHWPYYHAFSHCISVLTERDARAAYEIQSRSNSGDSVQAPGRDSENEPPSPLPPVYECLVDGVQHLWLIVPRRSVRKVNGLMQLSEEQMRAAMAFYGRTPGQTAAGNGTGSARGTDANVDDDVLVVTADCNSQPEEGDDAGFHADLAPVLVSCPYGNEVDAVAVAVLLLAQQVKILRHHHHRHSSGYRSARGGQSINSQAYRASRLIETDQGVSHVWKGLLEWQDVERVQTVLRSSVY